MPYIAPGRRKQLDGGLALFDGVAPVETWLSGDLAYVMTKLCNAYWNDEPHFATAATIVGVLDCVRHEFMRRLVDRYEDDKRNENGDVFETLDAIFHRDETKS